MKNSTINAIGIAGIGFAVVGWLLSVATFAALVIGIYLTVTGGGVAVGWLLGSLAAFIGGFLFRFASAICVRILNPLDISTRSNVRRTARRSLTSTT